MTPGICTAIGRARHASRSRGAGTHSPTCARASGRGLWHTRCSQRASGWQACRCGCYRQQAIAIDARADARIAGAARGRFLARHSGRAGCVDCWCGLRLGAGFVAGVRSACSVHCMPSQSSMSPMSPQTCGTHQGLRGTAECRQKRKPQSTSMMHLSWAQHGAWFLQEEKCSPCMYDWLVVRPDDACLPHARPRQPCLVWVAVCMSRVIA